MLTLTASCSFLYREFAVSKSDDSPLRREASRSVSHTNRSGETMFTPHSLGIALMMMITSAICWASWANTYKGVKNYRFELFYWDYAIGIFLISLILAFTMGSTGHDANSFVNNVQAADA